MKLKLYAMIACLAATAGVAACDDDPTSEGVGDPSAIVTTLSTTTRETNTTFNIGAFAVDANLHRIPGALQLTAGGAGVSLDSTVYSPELAETRFYLKTGGTAVPDPGVTLTVTGSSLTEEVQVIVVEPAAP